ncbi:MAG TPA: protoheme IX farnesyltransferase, partial [Azospira sp.]|nr:protoheme IX farnesyltransferase [Azospira sp.]
MQGHSQTATATLMQKLAGFAELCKPRVNSLIVFTAMIGMLLPSRELPPMKLFLLASLGIGLVACSAAAINCLVER